MSKTKRSRSTTPNSRRDCHLKKKRKHLGGEPRASRKFTDISDFCTCTSLAWWHRKYVESIPQPSGCKTNALLSEVKLTPWTSRSGQRVLPWGSSDQHVCWWQIYFSVSGKKNCRTIEKPLIRHQDTMEWWTSKLRIHWFFFYLFKKKIQQEI